MRKSVVISSLVAAATITLGLTAGVSSASSPEAAPPSIPSPAEILDNLTPEQTSCLLENVSGVDTNDVDAMFALLEQCNISLTDLTSGGSVTSDPLTSDPLTSDPLAALDPFANIGIDASVEVCIAASVAAAPPADDNAALAVLQGCGASLVDITNRIGAGAATTSSTPASSTPTSGDPFVDLLRTELEKSGIELTDAQLQCLTDAVIADPSADYEDTTLLLNLMESCDINMSDIA